jgi:hypothetical protein
MRGGLTQHTVDTNRKDITYQAILDIGYISKLDFSPLRSAQILSPNSIKLNALPLNL